MKVVAFLQNMWVRDPRHVAKMNGEDPLTELRETLIRYCLFAGCLTGRRLKKAFGEPWCDAIIWQEASPIVDSNPKRYHAPDESHIRAVLTKHEPKIVLCFTKAGEPVVKDVLTKHFTITHFIAAVHPAARGKDTEAKLKQASDTLNLLAFASEAILAEPFVEKV
jgi:hypothetical protein